MTSSSVGRPAIVAHEAGSRLWWFAEGTEDVEEHEWRVGCSSSSVTLGRMCRGFAFASDLVVERERRFKLGRILLCANTNIAMSVRDLVGGVSVWHVHDAIV